MIWEIEKKFARREGDFEISVIRKDNEHGHNSWGWPCDEKIIFDGRNYSEDMATKCAEILCEALNNEN